MQILGRGLLSFSSFKQSYSTILHPAAFIVSVVVPLCAMNSKLRVTLTCFVPANQFRYRFLSSKVH